ncbi:MAG: hypothetical protein R3C17_01970 [Planctomycetaceae bacterium]
MRAFLTATLLLGITIPLSAQELKPGTPEWDRRFAELRKKGDERAGRAVEVPFPRVVLRG